MSAAQESSVGKPSGANRGGISSRLRAMGVLVTRFLKLLLAS